VWSFGVLLLGVCLLKMYDRRMNCDLLENIHVSGYACL
jgi:hypothetical protein